MLFETTTDAADAATPTLNATPAARTKPRSKAGLTDTALRALKPQAKPYKLSDGKGLYVMVLPSGTKTLRFDYRLLGSDGKPNRETLTIGRYEPGTESRSQEQLDALDYGSVVSLADARALRDRASRQVKAGTSPSKSKVQQRTAEADADTFGAWVQRYFDFKADPKSGDEQLADSTLELRRSVYRRTLEQALGKKTLKEIKAATPKGSSELGLAALFDAIKAERGPGPAVHARELQSTVLAQVCQAAADGTLLNVARVSPSAGSVTIYGNANATATTVIDWCLFGQLG